MSNCPRCKTEMGPNENFCPSCGYTVSLSSENTSDGGEKRSTFSLYGVVRDKKRGDDRGVFSFLVYPDPNNKDKKDKVEASMNCWEQVTEEVQLEMMEITGYRDPQGIIQAEKIKVVYSWPKLVSDVIAAAVILIGIFLLALVASYATGGMFAPILIALFTLVALAVWRWKSIQAGFVQFRRWWTASKSSEPLSVSDVKSKEDPIWVVYLALLRNRYLRVCLTTALLSFLLGIVSFWASGPVSALMFLVSVIAFVILIAGVYSDPNGRLT